LTFVSPQEKAHLRRCLLLLEAMNWRIVALVALLALYDGYSRFQNKEGGGGGADAQSTQLADGSADGGGYLDACYLGVYFLLYHIKCSAYRKKIAFKVAQKIARPCFSNEQCPKACTALPL
jgi:hypothetical protein